MKILLLSPHTDDVELGAGGTVAKFVDEGHEIKWIVFSTCEESLSNELPKDMLKKEFMNVTKALGLEENNSVIHNFKVRHLRESRQDILEELIKIRKEFNPNLVICPSLNDLHQDHQVVVNEALRAFKNHSSIISYELPWNHINSNKNLFIKLDEKHIKKKINLLQNYKSQIKLNRKYFSSEFISGLARVRGVQCNADYAEAFEVIRWMM